MDMHPRVKYSFTLDAKSKAIEVYNREIVVYIYFLALRYFRNVSDIVLNQKATDSFYHIN
jgi:hypothetical protein